MGISNTGGKVYVELTPEQAEFMKLNCQKNIDFARNQLLAWSTLPNDQIEALKESFLKLDGMKKDFEGILKAVEKASD